jgi:hypothetical protein
MDDYCCANHLNCVRIVSPAAGDHAEQMQAIRMIGIDGQNTAIDLLGFAQAPCTMMLKSVCQQSRNEQRSFVDLRY